MRWNLETPGWMLVWGGLVGLFTGGVTVLYRLAVIAGNHAIWGENLAGAWLSPMLRLVMPALGGLLAGVLLYRWRSYTPGHGIPLVIHSVQTNQIRFPWRMALPSFASVIVLTSGGSAGPEGPVAEIGSVFGSNVGRILNVSQRSLRTLVGSGVAAAIAAVFGAPIGGVFFAVEVIFQGFEVAQFAPVVLSAVVASLVSRAVFEHETVVALPAFTFNAVEFPAYILLGLLSGAIAGVYIFWMDRCSILFGKIKAPMWLKPALGGLGVGIIGLYLPRVIGEGYESMNQAFQGQILIHELFWMLAGKLVATGLTIGSGAPGGCFAPAIFIGGTLGGFYGALLEIIFPETITNPGAYALMGMAGMIAGSFNAPMTAILIGLRVSRESFDTLLPLMTTVALSTFVMSHWDHVSVYTRILRRHGRWFPFGYDRDPLLHISVADVVQKNPRSLPESMSAEEGLAHIRECDDPAFLVVDEQGLFRGVVSLEDLRLALADPMMGRLLNLSDVVNPALPHLTPKASLRDAVHLFSSTKAEALPVFEGGKELVGLVSRDAILSAYRRTVPGKGEG